MTCSSSGSAWEVIQTRVAQYMAAFLILSGLINGVFSALDGILFYVFFEAMLIPMYLIIGVWGGPNRVYAAIKFFLYTLLGSLLMLVALIYLYSVSDSFAILDWYEVPLAHAHADPAVRRVLHGVLGQGADVAGAHLAAGRARRGADRRLGGPRGDHAEDRRVRIRALHPADPARTRRTTWRRFVITLSLIAVIYIGFVALVQADMKKLIAYSSISHMGFVTLGFFLFSQLGVEGALAQMISHGFVSAAMFLCVGVLYDRMHTRHDRRLRRRREHDAEVRRVHDAVRDGQRGPAGHVRFRRRIPRDPGGGQGQFLAGLRAPR